MERSDLKLVVTGYRAIASANIAIGDITVITGPNASGKSTLSHIFHSICNLSIMYPQYLSDHIWGQVEKLLGKLRDLGGSLSGDIQKEAYSAIATKRNIEASQPDFKEMFLEEAPDSVLQKIRDYVSHIFDLYSSAPSDDANRAYAALVAMVNTDGGEISRAQVQDICLRKIDDAIVAYRSLLSKRNYVVYNQSSDEIRKWLWSEGEITLSEGENIVYNTKKSGAGIDPISDLKRIFGVSRAIYITSPLVSTPTLSRQNRIGFNDGFTFPAVQNQSFAEKDLFSILGGTIEAEEKNDFSGDFTTWKYRRSDGLEVTLDMCATGMRSFSILEILCKYSLLDPETLLIIDEPEAHLHPKWIVEYARVLVEIVKKLKIRLLLASHSPYFLNALERFITNEKIGDTVRFYEMQKLKDGQDLYKSEDVSKNLESVYRSMYEPFVG